MQGTPLAHEENCTEVFYIEDKAEDIVHGIHEEDDHTRVVSANYSIVARSAYLRGPDT